MTLGRGARKPVGAAVWAALLVLTLGACELAAPSTASDASDPPSTGEVSDGPAGEKSKPRAKDHKGDDGQSRDGGRRGDRGGSDGAGGGGGSAGSGGKTRRGTTAVVVRVVDGDTVELGNGETVRIVGIDTPEVGECGFDRASQRMAALVLGKQVRLTRSDEDRDHYGRLLRYIDVGAVDVGLRLIKEGLAIARYDSRDGYGFHPREPRYVAADKRSKPLCPVRAAQPATRGGRGSTGDSVGAGCAPGYAPCVPAFPPDLDCADVNGPVTVTGSDPHRLDGDGDGVACEWG
ncbi:thermonuclease family protein [Nocardioides sp. GCM10027113]|uniref:thermonuclease family protein n=1 Tax=unclassified Nocardioides TaxID=2615069 RepID=UPI0036071F49